MIKKAYILLVSILAIIPLLANKKETNTEETKTTKKIAKTRLYKNAMDVPVTLTINEGHLLEIPARSCKSVSGIKNVNILTIHTDKDNVTDTLNRHGAHPEINWFKEYTIVTDRSTPFRNFRLLNNFQKLFHETKVNCDKK